MQASREINPRAVPTESSGGRTVFEPLVSVIIPAYNRAHLIVRAVSSVLAQTYRHSEIVIVDDASTDALTTALAAIDDPRLRVVRHPLNRGAAAARNTGVASSYGEFVAFLDSDDTWHPDKLAFQVAAMRDQAPQIAGHVCGYNCVKAGFGARDIVPNWTVATFRRSQLFGCTCGPGTTLLCRRAIFADVGPFDTELRRLEDWDWLLRLAAKDYLLLPSSSVLAYVEVGSEAAPRDIEAAVRRIRAKHQASVARESGTARRIFAASLHLENAAAALGANALLRASIAILRSLACYPFRGAAFYWRLVQRATSAVGLSPVQRTPESPTQTR